MSLKAKIEAVIYASEEPVTLAQLLGLLGDEAQAELDRAVSAQQTLSLNETATELEGPVEADPTLLADSDAAAGVAVAEPTSENPVTEPNSQTAEPSDSAADLATDSSAADAAAGEAAAARAERALRRAAEQPRAPRAPVDRAPGVVPRWHRPVRTRTRA